MRRGLKSDRGIKTWQIKLATLRDGRANTTIEGIQTKRIRILKAGSHF